MAYRFESTKKDVESDIRRIAHEQIDEATSFLSPNGAHPVTGVHEARKRLKMLRALLRLVRQDLGPRVFRHENLTLRDIGRALSAVRDAHVLVETFDDVVESLPPDAANGLPALRQRLVQRRQDTSTAVWATHGPGRRAGTRLAAARTRVGRWPLSASGWKLIEPGVARTYRRGRRAFKDVRGTTETDGRHEWRKRVKDLWYHLRLMQPIWPVVTDGMIAASHELSDLLGDEHDLVVLRQEAAAAAGHGVPAPPALLGAIDDRLGNVREKADRLGERLYAERPAAFVGRIKRYWDAW